MNLRLFANDGKNFDDMIMSFVILNVPLKMKKNMINSKFTPFLIYFFEPTSNVLIVARFCIIFHYCSHDEITRIEFMCYAWIDINVIYLNESGILESLCVQKLEINLKGRPVFCISTSFVEDQISIRLVHPERTVEIFLVACVSKVI
jgi:hypothetical protein